MKIERKLARKAKKSAYVMKSCTFAAVFNL